jgi:hypothetical protein
MDALVTSTGKESIDCDQKTKTYYSAIQNILECLATNLESRNLSMLESDGIRT